MDVEIEIQIQFDMPKDDAFLHFSVKFRDYKT